VALIRRNRTTITFKEKGVKEMATPHPELNGQRVRSSNQNDDTRKVYLILDGQLRWIPNPETYNNLFRDWNGIAEFADISDIEEGEQITDGAILAKDPNSPPVYLLSFHQKRHIASPAAMDKYYFSWDAIKKIDKVALDSIPDVPLGDIV